MAASSGFFRIHRFLVTQLQFLLEIKKLPVEAAFFDLGYFCLYADLTPTLPLDKLI
jgi:hypothetical protein